MTNRDDTPEPIAAFITRWQEATGKEIANFQPFMRELCAVLGLADAPPETDETDRTRSGAVRAA